MQAFQRAKVLASPVLRASARGMSGDVVPKGFNVPRAKYIVGMVRPELHRNHPAITRAFCFRFQFSALA